MLPVSKPFEVIFFLMYRTFVDKHFFLQFRSCRYFFGFFVFVEVGTDQSNSGHLDACRSLGQISFPWRPSSCCLSLYLQQLVHFLPGYIAFGIHSRSPLLRLSSWKDYFTGKDSRAIPQCQKNSIAYDLIAILSPMPVKSCISRKSKSQRVTPQKQLYPDLKQRLAALMRKNLFLIKSHFKNEEIYVLCSNLEMFC